MVKFSKQLDGQLVPEWRPAYVDYKILKKELKRLKLQPRKTFSDSLSHSFRAAVHLSISADQGVIGQAATSSSIVVCPTLSPAPPVRHHSRARESFESLLALGGQAALALRSRSLKRRGARGGVIEVHKREGNPWETYETILLEPIDISRMEAAKVFFSRLDAQFNKVNQFYRSKEKEFVEQAETLEKQMQVLVDSRKALEETLEESSGPSNLKENFHDLEAGDLDWDAKASGDINMDNNRAIRAQRGCESAGVNAGVNAESAGVNAAAGLACGAQAGSSCNSRSTVVPQMRMRNPLPTAGTTISGISQTLWEDVLKQGGKSNGNSQTESQISVSKKKLQSAEKMLRSAFVEYYRGLNLLKSYSSLNMVAFAKILKKFDKISGQRASVIYLKVVETSYFNSSDKIIILMEKVETLYTQYFAKYNRHKAMLSLRPKHKKASHAVTFILGVFVGGSLALLAVFAVLVRIILLKYQPPPSDQEPQEGELPHSVYVKTILPSFSMVMLVLIHMYMYGADLYFWRRLRINYAFIFEFAPGTELRPREVLMATSVLTTVTVGCMVGHLALHSANPSPYVDFIPLGLVMLLVGILFSPINILYRSSRQFFLNSMLHIVASPFYKVVLADFFLADQLTSQVPMLRNMQYVSCYYLGGFFKTGNADACFSNGLFKGLTYLISLLPYWWRFMQCGRRFVDEGDQAHLANGGKYLSALVAVALRIQYARNSSLPWAILFVLSSILATIYQVYWDLVVDWGLLRRDSTNKWLRDQLIMPKKRFIYFISMILNVLLRLAWLQSVTRFHIGTLDPPVADFIFASLEVIRRGHWNFYRLENEHLNNVGKYRATKTVPLPFEDPTNDE